MKYQFFLLIILLVCQMSLSINLKQVKKTCLEKNATIQLTLDDTLDDIKINDVSQNITKLLDRNNWYEAKNITAIINPGDVISISGHDSNFVAPGLLATITYVDQNGNNQILNTGSSWMCNSMKAFEFGANDQKNTFWYGRFGKPISSIDLKAQWIWDDKKTEVMVCTVVIPGTCEKKIINNYESDNEY